MKVLESVETELLVHIKDLINDGVLTLYNVEDWHFHAFNESYYMIGHYQCEQWLKKHGIDAFDAIGEIVEYEQFNFGEVNTKLDNATSVVNMYVYIAGEVVLAKYEDELIEQLEQG